MRAAAIPTAKATSPRETFDFKGAQGTIIGLSSSPMLNGRVGKVLGRSNDRLQLALNENRIVLIHQKNLLIHYTPPLDAWQWGAKWGDRRIVGTEDSDEFASRVIPYVRALDGVGLSNTEFRRACREFDAWRGSRRLIELLFATETCSPFLAPMVQRFKSCFLAAMEAEVYPMNDHPSRPRIAHGAFFPCMACDRLFFVQSHPFGDLATVFFNRCLACISKAATSVKQANIAGVIELKPQVRTLLALFEGVIFFLSEKKICSLEKLVKNPAHEGLKQDVMKNAVLPFKLLNYPHSSMSLLLLQSLLTFFQISSSAEDEDVLETFQRLIDCRTTPTLEISALSTPSQGLNVFHLLGFVGRRDLIKIIAQAVYPTDLQRLLSTKFGAPHAGERLFQVMLQFSSDKHTPSEWCRVVSKNAATQEGRNTVKRTAQLLDSFLTKPSSANFQPTGKTLTPSIASSSTTKSTHKPPTTSVAHSQKDSIWQETKTQQNSASSSPPIALAASTPIEQTGLKSRDDKPTPPSAPTLSKAQRKKMKQERKLAKIRQAEEQKKRKTTKVKHEVVIEDQEQESEPELEELDSSPVNKPPTPTVLPPLDPDSMEGLKEQAAAFARKYRVPALVNPVVEPTSQSLQAEPQVVDDLDDEEQEAGATLDSKALLDLLTRDAADLEIEFIPSVQFDKNKTELKTSQPENEEAFGNFGFDPDSQGDSLLLAGCMFEEAKESKLQVCVLTDLQLKADPSNSEPESLSNMSMNVALWEVVYLERALRKLDTLAPSLRESVRMRLCSLSQGYRSLGAAKLLQLSSRDRRFPWLLFESRLPRGYRMIWQVDWDWSNRRQSMSEVLRVWDVVTHDLVDRVVHRVVSCWRASFGRFLKFQKALQGHKMQAQVPRHVTRASGGTSVMTYPRLLIAPSGEDGKLHSPLDVEGFISLNASELNLQSVALTKKAERPKHAAFDSFFLDSYVLDKFITLSGDLLNFLQQGNVRHHFHLFRLSPVEEKLVHLPGSVMVSGRSGTGKTTTGLLRLVWQLRSFFRVFHGITEQQIWEHLAETSSPPDPSPAIGSTVPDLGTKTETDSKVSSLASNQTEKKGEDAQNPKNPEMNFRSLFLARSPRLCDEAFRFVTKLIQTFPELTRPPLGASSSFSSPWAHLPFEPPVCLTLTKFLSFVDLTLTEPFARTVTLQAETGDNQPSDMWTPEATQTASNSRVSAQARANLLGEEDTSSEKEMQLLEYSAFLHELAPIIRQRALVKAVKQDLPHDSLIWRYMMSFIKGSWLAARQPQACLSLEQFLALGRKQGRLGESQRRAVYAFFQEYEKEKKRLRMYDVQDRVSYILRRLWTEGYKGVPYQSVVVDEAQDLSQTQLAIVMCVSHPKGLYICADSCQTIALDVEFRMCDFTSLFFQRIQFENLERDEVEKQGEPELEDPTDDTPAESKINRLRAKQRQASFKVEEEKQVQELNGWGISHSRTEMPEQVQLVHNFRTHSQVLALSNVCVDLLEILFEDSIDKMMRDEGYREGPRPVLIDMEPASLNLCFMDAINDHVKVDFGAHQAVIVRSEASKAFLPTALKSGLVLTVEQAKGLEFDTVILFNMFQDSLVDKREWAVVLIEKYLNAETRKQMRAVDFLAEKHGALCSELKILYTAITRCRWSLFLVEAQIDAPLLRLWEHLGLLTRSKDIDSMKSVLSSRSSVEEWAKQGDKFFADQRWDLAELCYSKAGSQHERFRARCEAFQRAVNASHKIGRAKMEREEKKSKGANKTLTPHALMIQGRADYAAASKLLLEAGFLKEAFNCLWSAQMYGEAAMLCAFTNRWADAAMCWRKEGSNSKASVAYAASGDVKSAVDILSSNLRTRKEVDQLLKFVRPYFNLGGDDVERAVAAAARWFVEQKDPEGVMNCVRGFKEDNLIAVLVRAQAWDVINSHLSTISSAEAQSMNSEVIAQALQNQGNALLAADCYHKFGRPNKMLKALLEFADIKSLWTDLSPEMVKYRKSQRSVVLAPDDAQKLHALLLVGLRPSANNPFFWELPDNADKKMDEEKVQARKASELRLLEATILLLLLEHAESALLQASTLTLVAKPQHFSALASTILSKMSSKSSVRGLMNFLDLCLVLGEKNDAWAAGGLMKEAIGFVCRLTITFALSQEKCNREWSHFGMHWISSVHLKPPPPPKPPRRPQEKGLDHEGYDPAELEKWERDKKAYDEELKKVSTKAVPSPFLILPATCQYPLFILQLFRFRPPWAKREIIGSEKKPVTTLQGGMLVKKDVLALEVGDARRIVPFIVCYLVTRSFRWLNALLKFSPAPDWDAAMSAFFFFRDTFTHVFQQLPASFNQHERGEMLKGLGNLRTQVFQLVVNQALTAPQVVVQASDESLALALSVQSDLACPTWNQHVPDDLVNPLLGFVDEVVGFALERAFAPKAHPDSLAGVLLDAALVLAWIDPRHLSRLLVFRAVFAECTKSELGDNLTVVDELLLRQSIHLTPNYWPYRTLTKTDAEVSLEFLRYRSHRSMRARSGLMWIGVTFGLSLLKVKRNKVSGTVCGYDLGVTAEDVECVSQGVKDCCQEKDSFLATSVGLIAHIALLGLILGARNVHREIINISAREKGFSRTPTMTCLHALWKLVEVLKEKAKGLLPDSFASFVIGTSVALNSRQHKAGLERRSESSFAEELEKRVATYLKEKVEDALTPGLGHPLTWKLFGEKANDVTRRGGKFIQETRTPPVQLKTLVDLVLTNSESLINPVALQQYEAEFKAKEEAFQVSLALGKGLCVQPVRDPAHKPGVIDMLDLSRQRLGVQVLPWVLRGPAQTKLRLEETRKARQAPPLPPPPVRTPATRELCIAYLREMRCGCDKQRSVRVHVPPVCKDFSVHKCHRTQCKYFHPGDQSLKELFKTLHQVNNPTHAQIRDLHAMLVHPPNIPQPHPKSATNILASTKPTASAWTTPLTSAWTAPLATSNTTVESNGNASSQVTGNGNSNTTTILANTGSTPTTTSASAHTTIHTTGVSAAIAPVSTPSLVASKYQMGPTSSAQSNLIPQTVGLQSSTRPQSTATSIEQLSQASGPDTVGSCSNQVNLDSHDSQALVASPGESVPVTSQQTMEIRSSKPVVGQAAIETFGPELNPAVLEFKPFEGSNHPPELSPSELSHQRLGNDQSYFNEPTFNSEAPDEQLSYSYDQPYQYDQPPFSYDQQHFTHQQPYGQQTNNQHQQPYDQRPYHQQSHDQHYNQQYYDQQSHDQQAHLNDQESTSLSYGQQFDHQPPFPRDQFPFPSYDQYWYDQQRSQPQSLPQAFPNRFKWQPQFPSQPFSPTDFSVPNPDADRRFQQELGFPGPQEGFGSFLSPVLQDPIWDPQNPGMAPWPEPGIGLTDGSWTGAPQQEFNPLLRS